MLKNLILVSAVSLSFVACGGGSGGGSASGSGATCEQVIKASQALHINRCDTIFDLLSDKSYDSVNLETAEFCYSNIKTIQSAAGKTCTDPETGEQEELLSASEFAEEIKPLDDEMVALRKYYGVSTASPAPALGSSSVSSQETKCEKAAAIYAEQERYKCDALEEGFTEEELQTKEQQVAAYNIMKPCIDTLERLQEFAGLSCSDFEVPEKEVFDAILPAVRFALSQMQEIINKQ